MTPYVLFRMLVAFIFGTLWYMLDRRFGLGWHRWWHNLTHEHPMATDAQQGFVYGRSSKVRAFWGVLVATFITALALINGAFDPLMEVGMWIVAVPAAFLGLYIGPKIYSLWQKRDTAFQAVDKWERGEVDLTDELKHRTAEMGSRIKHTITSVADEVAKKGEPKAKPLTEAVPEPLPVEQKPINELEQKDPQDLVNKYLRRGED